MNSSWSHVDRSCDGSGSKQYDGAIPLTNDVEHHGYIDLRRRARDQLQAKPLASTSTSIQNDTGGVDTVDTRVLGKSPPAKSKVQTLLGPLTLRGGYWLANAPIVTQSIPPDIANITAANVKHLNLISYAVSA